MSPPSQEGAATWAEVLLDCPYRRMSQHRGSRKMTDSHHEFGLAPVRVLEPETSNRRHLTAQAL
jgi:hypothetical protein